MSVDSGQCAYPQTCSSSSMARAHGLARYLQSVATIDVPFSITTPTGEHAACSAFDDGHISFVVALAGGRREVAQPFDLLGAQLDAAGRDVLLDAGGPHGAGNRGDVPALREQPGQSDLCRCCARLSGNGLDLLDDAQVALEVIASEARVGLAPIVVGELLIRRGEGSECEKTTRQLAPRSSRPASRN